MKRKDIEDKYKWDNSDLFPNFKEWKKALAPLRGKIDDLDKYRGHLLDDAKTLNKYLEDSIKVEEEIERLEFYTFLACDVDINDSDAQQCDSSINSLIAEYNSRMSFVTPEIMAGGEKRIKELIAEEEMLKKYERVLLEPFRLKDHLLDEKGEAIFAEYDVANLNYCKSSEFIRTKELIFEPITLANGEVVELNDSLTDKYLRSDDRNVRRKTAESSNKAYEHNINSLATNYIGFVKNNEIEAKYRGYSSQLERVLFERKIPKVVYDKLKDALKKYNYVYDNYIKLYQDALNLDEVHAYDINAPLAKDDTKEYTYDEAREIIEDTFSIYGSWYTDILKTAFDKHLIDIMPSDEKKSGWFCAYTPYHNPRILGNFYNKINDIMALSHELGHFVNQSLTIKTQIPLEAYQDTSTAEVASLTNEILFANLIKKKESNKNTLLQVMGEFLKTFAGNFFGAGCELLFEERAHELVRTGAPVDAYEFNKIWLECKREITGTRIKDYQANVWAAIPHYYMTNGYYVYNYSIAIISACNVASKILHGEEGFIDKYHEFLKIGSNVEPMVALKEIGIDLATDEPYEVAIEMFEDVMKEFYKLMNEVR